MSVHNFEVRLEERLRKKAFAHYDCHSMIVDFGCPSSKYRVLQERRNTTTGASAASLVGQQQQQQQQNNNNQNAKQQDYNKTQPPLTNLHQHHNQNNLNNNNNNNNNNFSNDNKQSQINNGQDNFNSNKLTSDQFNNVLSNGNNEQPDLGDGRQNDLVLACPFFRNELGGEEERIVCLNKLTDRRQPQASSSNLHELHKPAFVGGISILESSSISSTPLTTSGGNSNNNNSSSLLKNVCPYQRLNCKPVIDYADTGATYYRHYFYGRDHQNWFGHSESYGPLAISILKEQTRSSVCNSNSNNNNDIKYHYRIIIRTSELEVLRGSVYEDCIPAHHHHHHSNNNRTSTTSAKDVLEYLLAKSDIQLNKLKLGTPNADVKLLNLDEHKLTRTFKVGVLYCKAGQSTEEEFYNNEHSGPLFDQFLACIGEQVRLLGFDKYRGGLDNKSDSTGLYSIYTTYNDCEIMFHVSTMLPYSANNRQQLSRKRHIGNDIVTIVFQEEGSLPFTPKTIRSQFQHVFIIVKALNHPPTSNALLPDGSSFIDPYIQPQQQSAPRYYSVAVSRSKEMPPFGPPIPESGTFIESNQFRNFLLAKIINAENAAHKYCEKFRTMGQRTRLGLLTDLAESYITNTTLSDFNSGSNYSSPSGAAVKIVSSLFGGGKKRSQRRYANFCGHSDIQGAIVWDVQVKDFGQSNKIIDCILGISVTYLVVIEQQTKELLYVSPIEAILGWTSNPAWIKIFCHQAECLLVQIKDPDVDEICEIVTRLKAVTNGCETRELTLRRKNSSQTSSLGFDIQPDGIVTRVDAGSIAWQTHLLPGSRLVEICKTSTATLSYSQMMEYIKTSAVVTLTVLPPNQDGSYRRGCLSSNCAHQPPTTIISRPSSTFSSTSGSITAATANNNTATHFSKPKRRLPTTSLMTLV